MNNLINMANKILLTSCLLILPSVGFSSKSVEGEDEQYEYLKEALVEQRNKLVEGHFSPRDTRLPKRGKQESEAILGTWLLSYSYNSPHTDKFVLDLINKSEGDFFAQGLYYPDQTGNGVLIVCVDTSSTSYICLTEISKSEIVTFNMTIKENTITKGFFGTGSTNDIAFKEMESSKYPVTGSRQSGTTKPATEAIYRDTNRELEIPVLNYNQKKYKVILQDQGNLTFTVKEVAPLKK